MSASVEITQILAKLAFAFYTIVIVAGAILAVSLRSLIRSLMGLVAVAFSIAGMYLLLAAPFLAFMQILIGVGAVIVIIFAAIMFTRTSRFGEESRDITPGRRAGALLAAFVPGVLFFGVIFTRTQKSIPVPSEVDPVELGKAMLGPYMLPFELISVCLLVAMAGSVLVIWRKRGKN